MQYYGNYLVFIK